VVEKTEQKITNHHLLFLLFSVLIATLASTPTTATSPSCVKVGTGFGILSIEDFEKPPLDY
jgi:hypothetical protein